ncbi:hypothetical protein DFH94DRAFT_196953 [Russula ochroleuca]|jgi:hypothetical protein|uniref:Uncharacterized protein n=1 Tax=Russula ochroleuca TaxID=152965 RepID=A0A9P5MQW7_9AGAM|nr:hypothetical protein DFH94DRAFT_196953 [Russula ochroleuca]
MSGSKDHPQAASSPTRFCTAVIYTRATPRSCCSPWLSATATAQWSTQSVIIRVNIARKPQLASWTNRFVFNKHGRERISCQENAETRRNRRLRAGQTGLMESWSWPTQHTSSECASLSLSGWTSTSMAYTLDSWTRGGWAARRSRPYNHTCTLCIGGIWGRDAIIRVPEGFEQVRSPHFGCSELIWGESWGIGERRR